MVSFIMTDQPTSDIFGTNKNISTLFLLNQVNL